MSALSSVTIEDDLPKVWAQIIERCNAITDWDLNEGKDVTVDQVLARINPPKAKSSAVKDEAKAVFKRTLVCVQRFGSFAANTASMVFGPSQQCFNAISFVITAVQSYDEVFSNITALLERVSVFMEKLRVYLDDPNADVKLDKRLRQTVYRVLEHFLVIMGKSHKLTKGWKGKLKLAAKVGAFGEDDGIKSALGRLETLISDVTRQEISVIVKELSETARNIRGVDRKLDALADAAEKTVTGVGQLTAAEDKRASAEQEKKDLDAVKEAFGIESDNESKQTQSDLWETHVPGTGEWLLKFKKPSFVRWANPKSPALHLIPLKAPGGYGKSFLSSIVIQHLQEKHKDDSRVVTAFYYHKEQDSTGKNTTLNKVFKSIIWQFVSSYKRDYLKAVVKACADHKPDFSNLTEVWKRFVTDMAKSIDATFYIVLDGLADLDAKQEETLVEIVRQIRTTEDANVALNIRLFLTGIPDVMDSLMEQLDPIHEIDLASSTASGESSFNETDLHLFIESRLKSMDRYNQDDDDSEMTELREEIKSKLSAGVRGDYSALGYKLDDIGDAYSVEDVKAILERAGETRQEEIAREISRLNETLTRPQILVINRLLAWSSMSLRYLTLKQYENIVSLGAETSMLISLEREIKERYSGLFVIKDDTVRLRTNDIVDYLKSVTESQTGATGFEKTEVDLVRRVLKTHFGNVFGGQDVYQRYRFDTFFDQKLADEEVRIRLSEPESCVTVTLGCLVTLCEKYDEPKYTSLLEYANEWFADHLALLKLEEVSVATKQDIGRKLVRLLRESELINAWWTEDRMFMTQYFVYDTFLTRAMFNWLKDKDVQKGMPDMPTERQWVIQTTAEKAPVVSIFSNVAKIMVKRWLENEDSRWYGAFIWLRGYVGWSTSDTEDEKPEYDLYDIPLNDINKVEEFARTQSTDNSDEAKWHIVMGRSHYENRHFTEAIKRYTQALELRVDEWQITYRIAQAHAGNDAYGEAVGALDDCMKRRDELLDANEEFTKLYWEQMLLSRGDWNMELTHYPAAEAAYREVLEHGLKLESFKFFTRMAIFNIVSILSKQSRHEEMIMMLSDLKDRREEDSTSWLCQFFDEYCWMNRIHGRLHGASKTIETYQSVVEFYEHTIADIKAHQDSLYTRLTLQIHLGSLKWRYGSREDQDAAIIMWEEGIYTNVDVDSADIDNPLAYITRYLASALLDRAKQAGLCFPLNSEASSYARRLQRLAEFDDDYMESTLRQGKLLLARMYHLGQDNDHAKAILREFIKEGFELAETPGSESRGYRRLGMVLQALDDDVNAIAAWELLGPDNPDDKEDDEDRDKDDDEEKDANEDKKKKTGTSETASEKSDSPAERVTTTTTNESETTPPTSDDGEDKNEKKEENASAKASEDPQAESTSPSQETMDHPEKPEYTGPLGDSCDGLCGKEWQYADDIYICKDCLSVWFCEDCHLKLRGIAPSPPSPPIRDGSNDAASVDATKPTSSATSNPASDTIPNPTNPDAASADHPNTFDPTIPTQTPGDTKTTTHSTVDEVSLDFSICSPTHTHLYVPAFDEARWKATPKGSMWVGGELVARKEWLSALRREWRLDEPSLRARARLVSAVRRIQRGWRLFRTNSSASLEEGLRR